MADRHHRTVRPLPDRVHQLIPETVEFIGVGRDQDTVQLFDRREAEHPPFLLVVVIPAREIAHRREYDDVAVQA